MGIMNHSNYY